jgi:2-polyprenyl-3-methyl-5-hydroxy-6-metoxy-1,4-benzoquinol methylase
MDAKLHWDKIYRTRRPTDVSWYRPHLEISLELIGEATADRGARIIDVGAGESTLVDDLVARGYRGVCAMDLSATALEVAKSRLDAKAAAVTWLRGDVLTFRFARHAYDVWHDRAVFHFLVDARDRAAYLRQVVRAVRPGGHVIVATFGPEGPTRCSGLDVVRYGPEALGAEFGTAFRPVRYATEMHRTPAGATQQFAYCCFSVGDKPGR